MKTLLLLSFLTLSSTISFANEEGEGPGNATGTENFEVLAETTNPQNIRLNGKSLDRCVLYAVKRQSEDGKEIKYIKIGVANKGRELESISLFEIDENGDYAKRWYYSGSDQVANKLSQRQLEYGYKFNSDSKKIEYSNGSSCMSQDSFQIKLKNGNLNEATSIRLSKGMCNTAQVLLAVPSAIFGADTHGNDLKCNFSN